MNGYSIAAPYIHTDLKSDEHAKEWLTATVPLLIWSIFMFGARVATICAVAAGLSLLWDYLVRRFILKYEHGSRLDIMASVYGILAAFMMPVTVPLWIPVISSVLIVIAKNLRGFRKKIIFNPFVFSAAVLNIVFPSFMTAFTKPFAYFSAFDIVIDPKLIDGYRVISPLQYMADGSVYEDGVLAQLYGFASGCMGEIAVAAIILSAVWLFFRKAADPMATASFLVPILLLALVFPSDDAESNYYAYSVLLSGGIVFLSVYAMNDKATVPLTGTGRMMLGILCGTVIFFLRKYSGGFEWGYIVILVMNLLSPFVELLTRPKAIGKKVKANEE